MTQLIRWLAPGEIETDISERVDNGSESRFSVTQYAEECSVASCSIVVRDPDGDFHIVGLNRIDIREEDSISDDPYIWIGNCDIRTEKRGRYLTGPSRDIEMNLLDQNNTASKFILGDTEDADRPAEDHGDRIAWLLTTDCAPTLVDDSLVLITTAVAMPAYDYTGMTPQQVIDDCARASGYQNFIWYNGATEEQGLAYALSGGDWYESDIRLSNVISEVDDSTTFYLGADAGLEWDPSRVASRVFARGNGIDTVRTNDSTEDLFSRRDVAMDFPTVRSEATLNARTNRSLAADLDTETVTIKGTVYLPSTHASMFKAGMKFDLHATHLTGFQDEFAPVRLVMTNHELLTPTVYKVEWEAEPATAAPVAPCFAGATPSGTYEPVNSESAPTGAIAFYSRPGLPDPVIGSSYAGDWHFGEMGTGGSPDVAGYLAANTLLIGVRGAGTVTIQTTGPNGPVDVPWKVGTGVLGLGVTGEYDSGTIDAGDELELTMDTNDGEFCEHWVWLNFVGNEGLKVGYAGAVWVSTEV